MSFPAVARGDAGSLAPPISTDNATPPPPPPPLLRAEGVAGVPVAEAGLYGGSLAGGVGGCLRAASAGPTAAAAAAWAWSPRPPRRIRSESESAPGPGTGEAWMEEGATKPACAERARWSAEPASARVSVERVS
eukprot:COSAG01_NODE_184_length_22692_cov_155.762758_20_plen_134_part_00